MNKYRSLLFFVTAVACMASLCLSCKKNEPDTPVNEDFDVQFVLPASMEVSAGGTATFTVKDGKAPLQSDVMMLTSVGGTSTLNKIENTSAESFTVRLGKDIVSGQYQVYLRRDQRKKSCGTTYLNVVSAIDFEPDKNSTVYGKVSCDGKGIAGVVVSDGVVVTTTDDKGIYQLQSEKKWGYVFISVPSGYEVLSDGVLPKLHSYLRLSASELERADFELKAVPDQDNYKMLFFGDMHLANRTNDRKQFEVFTADMNAYRKAHNNEKFYAMTLGDMTWDLYWYNPNNYKFPEYLSEINSQVKNLQVFHTIGNHDNDYKAKNDFDASFLYTRDIGPTFYSFNIGKIHYIVLDDINCSLYDGSTSRNYFKSVTNEQLEWLQKDLSYVSKSTPLVITTHAQIFYPNGNSFKIDHDRTNTIELLNLLKGYKTHFVTGHTHTIFNASPDETTSLGAENCYEHNAGSICASWWWSGSLTPGVYVSLDGSPAGYSIWDINGTDIKWQFKATGWDESHQFRAYDLNQISFTLDDVPNMSTDEKVRQAFNKYIDAYPKNSNNEVLINIWNWSSEWKLDVTDENGNTLAWTRSTAYDPVHIAALTVKRFNNGGTSVPNFITENKMPHFFKVKAANADVDLTITVTDEFGNVYTQTMKRPQVFNLDDYKK